MRKWLREYFTARQLLFLVVLFAALCFQVLFSLNLETWLQKHGYDRLIIEYEGPIMEAVKFLFEILASQFVLGFAIGGVVASFWGNIQGWLSRAPGVPTEKKPHSVEKTVVDVSPAVSLSVRYEKREAFLEIRNDACDAHYQVFLDFAGAEIEGRPDNPILAMWENGSYLHPRLIPIGKCDYIFLYRLENYEISHEDFEEYRDWLVFKWNVGGVVQEGKGPEWSDCVTIIKPTLIRIGITVSAIPSLAGGDKKLILEIERTEAKLIAVD